MRLKKGAKLFGIRPELMFGLAVAEGVYADRDLVVTEVTGGKHMAGSRHSIGMAADLRAREFEDKEAVLIADTIADRLGDQFDVILERKKDGTVSHIHLEFDPR